MNVQKSFISRWSKALQVGALAAGLLASSAHAEADTFSIGTGQDGPLQVTASDTKVNRYAALTANVAAGALSLQVGSTEGFAANDLVMVMHMSGISMPTADQPVDLGPSNVGRWELARISSVSTNTLTLTQPLLRSFPGGQSQVVLVPEYTSVTVANGGSIVAEKWNGQVGGVVAFLSNETIQNDGVISASRMGFRGGVVVNESSGLGYAGCTALNGPDNRPGALANKGESVVLNGYGVLKGRANAANGGGGGVCHNSGGGGGGNGSAGGRGGNTDATVDGHRPMGGFGGAAMRYNMLEQITLGGGGGAGQGNNLAPSDLSPTASRGGHGGGIIFLRARALTGNGIVEANGETAANPARVTFDPQKNAPCLASDGAGGGGAGGSIYLRFAGPATCSAIRAQGGNGGSPQLQHHGPGGGGGGGRIYIQASSVTGCPVNDDSVKPGSPGTQPNPNPPGGLGPNYGATPGGNPPSGTVEVVTPGYPVDPNTIEPPVILTPPNNSSTTNTRPPVTGTAPPNSTVVVTIDGQEVGTTPADNNGNWSLVPPTPLAPGPHEVTAVARTPEGTSAPSVPNRFTVLPPNDNDGGTPGETDGGTPPPPPDYYAGGGGFSCQQGPSGTGGLVIVGLLVLAALIRLDGKRRR